MISRTIIGQALPLSAATALATTLAFAAATPATAQPAGCPGDNGGITLSPGFCATVFADKLGHARHLAVAPNGVVYVNTWSGRYYHNDTPPPGGFLIALQDTKGNGQADKTVRFGPSLADGDHGGTGIAIYQDHIYAETNDRIVRYPLPTSGTRPDRRARGRGVRHAADRRSSDASVPDRQGRQSLRRHGVGDQFLPEPEPHAERAWQQALHRTGNPRRHLALRRQQAGSAFLRRQSVLPLASATARVSASIPPAGSLPPSTVAISSPRTSPSSTSRSRAPMNRPRRWSSCRKARDYGWPECYYDYDQKKLVLAPEYGGDGGKAIGICAQKQPPVAAFPAHWAPNDLLIYQGSQFPAGYKDGAFIAFHGSWNRAPSPQGGYNVVFQPLEDGKASKPFVVFADGFAGAIKEPGRATHRPTGLAVGPDGALYIADDQGGRIWRVTFAGTKTAAIAPAAPAPVGAQAAASTNVPPPEGIHPDAGAGPLPIPPGASPDQVALGDRIFHGQADGGACAGCHSADGKGTAVGSDLTSGKWLWGDGSVQAITRTITQGVPQPKDHTGAMPPMGGAQLSQADVAAVADYVWAIGHRGAQ